MCSADKTAADEGWNEKNSTSSSLSKNSFKMVEQGQLHIKLLAVGSQGRNGGT